MLFALTINIYSHSCANNFRVVYWPKILKTYFAVKLSFGGNIVAKTRYRRRIFYARLRGLKNFTTSGVLCK